MNANPSKFLLLLAFLFTLTMTVGCKKDNNSGGAVLMDVAPKLVIGGASPPASPSNRDTVYYYEITEQNPSQKLLLAKGTIQGFDYVEGYQYKIKVQITHPAKPMADGPVEYYSLVQVLSKTKVDSL